MGNFSGLPFRVCVHHFLLNTYIRPYHILTGNIPPTKICHVNSIPVIYHYSLAPRVVTFIFPVLVWRSRVLNKQTNRKKWIFIFYIYTAFELIKYSTSRNTINLWRPTNVPHWERWSIQYTVYFVPTSLAVKLKIMNLNVQFISIFNVYVKGCTYATGCEICWWIWIYSQHNDIHAQGMFTYINICLHYHNNLPLIWY